MYRLGFTLHDYMFKVEGDDIFLCTLRPLDIVAVSTVLEQWHYYWEIMPSDTPFELLTFKGTHPSGDYYTYRDDLLQGIFYWGGNPSFYAQKVCSLTQDLYYSPYYLFLRNYLEKVFEFFKISFYEQDILRRSCSPFFLEALYRGFERQSRQLNTPREKLCLEMQRKKLNIKRVEKAAVAAAVQAVARVPQRRWKQPQRPKPRKQATIRRPRDYMTSAPVPVNYLKTITKPQPNITSTQHGIRVKHSEFNQSLEMIAGDDGLGFTFFTQTTEPGATDVNPGFASFLPWLYNIAKCWDRYRVHGLRFRLIPKQGTSASGFIMAAFCYDFTDNPPADKAAMLTMMTSAESSAYAPLLVPCDTKTIAQGAMAGGWRYISNNATSSLFENRESMAGYLVVAVDGLGLNTRYSWDLWIDYDFELSVPRAASEPSEAIYYSGFHPAIDPESVAAYQLSADQGDGHYRLQGSAASVPIVETAFGNALGNVTGVDQNAPGAYNTTVLADKGVFRLGKPRNGVLTVNMSWASGASNGGVTRPDAKGSTNLWNLKCYNAATGEHIADPVSYVQSSNTIGNGPDSPAQVRVGANYNPSGGNTDTNGLSVSFYLGPAFWATTVAKGLTVGGIVFGLVNVGNAVLGAQLALTKLGLAFNALNRDFHRIASLTENQYFARLSDSPSDDEFVPEAPVKEEKIVKRR